jgi:hypothetical protein
LKWGIDITLNLIRAGLSKGHDIMLTLSTRHTIALT